MKKIVLTLAAALFASTMFAQSVDDKAAAKAAKEAEKAKKAAEKQAKNEAYAKFNEAMKYYEEANGALSALGQYKQMEKNQDKVAAKTTETNAKMLELSRKGSPILSEALATGLIEEKKFFDAYHAQDFMLSQLINVELQHASKKEPFDTAYFSKAANEMCDACHMQIKYGKTSDDQQKVILAQVKAKFPRLYTYLAYATQFEIENKNLDGAIAAFENYKNFPKKYPEVANEEEVKNPSVPFSMFAFNIYYTAYSQGKYDVCNQYYDEAMQYDDPNSHAFVEQSRPQMLLQKGDTIAWANELKAMIARDPSSSTAEVATQNLLAYYSKKGVDQMAAFADEMLAKDENNKIANYGKGYSLVVQNKYEEATKYYEKCIDIDPNYFEAVYQCGFCYYQIGLENGRKISDKKYKTQAEADKDADTKVKSYLRKALPYFERARDLKPEDPMRWASELKVIYNNLGMKDKAKELPEI